MTTETHHGYNKIAHMTGLGRKALRTIATDGNLKMNLDDLRQRVTEDRNNGFFPLMVVGTAGTTGTGVIDPLPGLGRFCRKRGYGFTLTPHGVEAPFSRPT